jgi:hypothetical protein
VAASSATRLRQANYHRSIQVSEEKLRDELQASFKNRAILYYLIFDELRKEIGPDRAEEILKRAIYRRGEQIGAQFTQYGPDNLDGLKNAFLAIIPEGGRMFDPQVQHSDAAGLDIHLEACPLKDAWEELDLSEEDRITMCRIAGEIDKGTFEAAGFQFEPDTWQPGRSGCCHLHIRPGA